MSADRHDEDDLSLSDFGDLISNLRAADQTVVPEVPPAEVWRALADAIGLSDEQSDTVVDFSDARRRRESRLQRGRRYAVAVAVAVAAALLLVAVPVGLALRGDGDDRELVASASLDVLLPSAASPGSAELVRRDDHLELDLEAAAWAEGSSFLEVWLLEMDPEGEIVRLVSLGPLTPSGRYVVPDGVGTQGTWAVDVSIEPDDGNADHSGQSVLRGALA